MERNDEGDIHHNFVLRILFSLVHTASVKQIDAGGYFSLIDPLQRLDIARPCSSNSLRLTDIEYIERERDRETDQMRVYYLTTAGNVSSNMYHSFIEECARAPFFPPPLLYFLVLSLDSESAGTLTR